MSAGWDLKIPTAIPRELGSQQWSIGPIGSITLSKIGNWQISFILENYFSFTNNELYGYHATSVFQPNIYYAQENGLYYGIRPLWTYDYKVETWTIPVNFRLGYIFQTNKYKYNTYIEPEWMVYRTEGAITNSSNFSVRLGYRIFLKNKKES